MKRRRFLKWLGLGPAAGLLCPTAGQDVPKSDAEDPITAAMAVIEQIKKFPHREHSGFIYPMRCKCGREGKGELGFARFHLTGPMVGSTSQRWSASFFSTPVGYGDSPIEAIRNAAQETFKLLRDGRDWTCSDCWDSPATTITCTNGTSFTMNTNGVIWINGCDIQYCAPYTWTT